MAFLNQIMLLGLAGIGVPILIHLLNRYRYREVDWGAMELLRRAMVVRSRRVRIEDLILLILRCLAVALLALAMARPTIGAAGAQFFGGQSRVGVVIALDASYSMGHRPGVHSRMDAAKRKARDILRTLQPGDQASIVLMGQRPRALLRNVSFDAQRLEEKLQQIEPLPERLNLELGLEQAAELIAEVRAPVRECYVITDGQDLSWRNLSDRARKSLMEIGTEAKLYCLPAGAGGAENLALTDFQMTSGARRVGSMVRYAAEVRNAGRQPVRNVAVTLHVGRRTADRRVVDVVPPGSSVPVALYGKFQEPGNVQVTARLDRDALPADDARHAAAHVRRQVKVLVVDGDPGRRRDEPGETFFLTNALVPNPDKAWQATIQPTPVPYVELPLHRPGDYDIIVLANVSDIRTPQAEALAGFVRRGGGLIVFLGDRVSGRLLNARMTVGDESILPAEIGRAVDAGRGEQAGWAVELADPDHPLGRFLARLPRGLVEEARVRKLMELEPKENARVVLRAAGTKHPLLIERRLGRGSVLLMATSADRDWASLAVNPAYLIFLHESVTYLTRRSHERQFTVGEPLIVPVPAAAVEDELTLVDPDGEATPIQAAEDNGQRVARCGQPEQAGFYTLNLSEDAEPLMMAVNVDASESDIRTLTDEEMRARLAETPARLLTGDAIAPTVKQGRTGREMWKTLMILALAVLLIESLLARRFSRKLEAQESPLPKSAREEVLAGRQAA